MKKTKTAVRTGILLSLILFGLSLSAQQKESRFGRARAQPQTPPPSASQAQPQIPPPLTQMQPSSPSQSPSQSQPRSQTPSGSASKGLVSKDGKTTLALANPEDITNENFPNLIESFDYPNAQLSEVVKAISKLTGKNFILEKNVGGTISIIAPSQITVAEAYNAFLTALAMNNYVIVPSGKFLKIRQISQATREAIDTYSGNYFPNTDQFITRILKLKYINADEVEKTLSPLINSQGSIKTYSPTNSLIVTDFGSNIERIMSILNQLDVPGFEEKLVVINIKFARAKDISDLIDQIINKGDKSKNQFNAGIPRFRAGGAQTTTSGSGAANYSLVIPDGRTNSIIVVGNDAGIERIRGLVAKLDFRLRPEDAGGVYVYYVRYGESEKIANSLNGIATESSKTKTQAASNTAPPAGGAPGAPAAAASQAVFGGDVKVTADKENNALIITCSKQDYEIVRAILAKVDIPRDQVFVKAIIMEMSAGQTNNWGVNYYKFVDGTNGAGRAGFVTSEISSLTSPTNDSGLVLGFGSDEMVEISAGGSTIEVPSLFALIKFLKNNQGGNILSTPQITALDNEEALIEVGDNVPVSLTSVPGAAGTTPTQSVDRKDLTLKLKITPFISPDTDAVRLKIEQEIKQLSPVNLAGAAEIASKALAYSTRTINTAIVVNSSDTAVLGGLMQDKETENITKVPVLGDIPIIGWLFKAKNTTKQKSNLLVFITPKILRTSQDNADLLDQKLNERIDFIQQTMKGRDPHGYEVDRLPRRALLDSTNQNFIEDTSAPIKRMDENESAPNDETESTEPGDGAAPAEDALPGDYEEGE